MQQMHSKLPVEEGHPAAPHCILHSLRERSRTSDKKRKVSSHCSISDAGLKLPHPIVEQNVDTSSGHPKYVQNIKKWHKKAYQELEGGFGWNMTAINPLEIKEGISIQLDKYHHPFALHYDNAMLLAKRRFTIDCWSSAF